MTDAEAAPYRIRMMAEVGCDFALWGEVDRPLPSTGEEDADDLEHVLPISESLRDRILAWAQEYYRFDGGEHDIDMADFDERGMMLSRELQRELGPMYSVQYHFEFGGKERLLPKVADDPCPGWKAS